MLLKKAAWFSIAAVTAGAGYEKLSPRDSSKVHPEDEESRKQRLLTRKTTVSSQGFRFGLTSKLESAKLSKESFVRGFRSAVVFCRLTMEYKLMKVRNRNREGSEEHEKDLKHTHERGASLVLELCKTNCGMFIKLGQHAAALKSALPEEYIVALQVLQDKAPAKSFELVEMCLREELGLSDEMPLVGPPTSGAPFSSLDQVPVGSASLAQVHRATLQDGSDVAVKIQHYGLLDVVSSDVQLIKLLDRLASKIFSEDNFSLSWAVTEFEDNILHELDFAKEARNCCRARDIIAADESLRKKVIIPNVYAEYCTDKLIVMDFVDGIPLNDVPRLKQLNLELNLGICCEKLADLIVETFGAMFFKYGYFHCDPHPGNLMVATDGTNRLVLLDHGLYRDTGEKFRNNLCAIWRAMVLQNKQALQYHCTEIGLGKRWELIPFVLINRSMETTAQLGKQSYLSAEQRAQVLSKLGMADLSIARIGVLFQELSSDFLWVLRTMHLVKDLHHSLGGRKRSRFKIYLDVANDSFLASQNRLVNEFIKQSFRIRFWLHELAINLYLNYYTYYIHPERLDSTAHKSISELFKDSMKARKKKKRRI